MEGEFDDMESMGIGYAFYQEHHHALQTATSRVDRLWILHDSQSTLDEFSNGKLLRNIRRSKRSLNLLHGRSGDHEPNWRSSRIWCSAEL